jgi:hypothetical protein
MAYAGAAAAAAAQQQRELEEEHMTQYTPNDVADEWEFKIVRSVTNAFRQPATLQTLIEEEARAGWVMLEKFDDARVRFKRRRSARTNDANLPAGYDPYRTRYGISDGAMAAIIIGAVILFFVVMFVILAIVDR